MSAHNPIASCCSRPQFNAVGGIDDSPWTFSLNDNSLINRARKARRTTTVIVAGILVALVVVCARALILLSN